MSPPENKKSPDLLADPVGATLKSLTIPMIYGLVMLMTFNLVDTFFVGLLGTKPLAAISFTFPITFTVISLTIGLGIGTSAVIAKALGKKDLELARNLSSVAIYLAGLVVGGLAFIGYLLIDEIFLALGASNDILPLIHQYMDLWFIGSVCLIGPMIGNAILRASGDTKTPSFIMGSAGLINALLDPILIFGWGPVPALGLEGAAIATIISWLVGSFMVFYILVVKKRLVDVKILPFSTYLSASKSILHIGLPAAGANMLTPISAAILTAIVAKYGEHAVAAFGVGSRIESIACLIVLALSMTLPPFISQNFGAGNMHRVKQAFNTSVKFVMAWQLLIYFILVLIAQWIAFAFAKEEAVEELIVLFIWILPLGYGLQGIIILTNSSFNALHKPMTALALSIVRLFVCYVPLSYLGSLLYGITGFFIGGVLGNLAMACLSYYLFNRQFDSLCEQRKCGYRT